MRVVAIAAGNAGAVHAALQKRAVHDFIENLTVSEVQALIEQRWRVEIKKVVTRLHTLGQLAAPAMARCTSRDLRGLIRQIRKPGLSRTVYMLTARAMTGFTPDRQLGKTGVVGHGLAVVVFAQRRRMTICTHEIPCCARAVQCSTWS